MMNNGFPAMMGNFGWGFGGIFMVVLLVGLIVWTVYFITRLISSRGLRAAGGTPMEILKKRYAKGEISKDDFEKMKKDF